MHAYQPDATPKRSVVRWLFLLIASALFGFHPTGTAHGQSLMAYQGEVNAMDWRDLQTWLERASLSEGQQRRVADLFEQYLETMKPEQAEFDRTYEELVQGWQSITERTLKVNWKVDQDQFDLGDRILTRTLAADKLLLEQISAVCADEQLPAIEWAQQQRKRTMLRERVATRCRSTGRKYVELRDVVSSVLEQWPDEFTGRIWDETLDRYEAALTPLVMQMHKCLAELFPEGRKRMLDLHGDVPSDPIWSEMNISIWGTEGNRFLRAADRMDGLNDRTVRELVALVEEDLGLMLRMEYHAAVSTIRVDRAMQTCRDLLVAARDAGEDVEREAAIVATYRSVARRIIQTLVDNDRSLRPRQSSVGRSRQASHEIGDRRVLAGKETAKAVQSLVDASLPEFRDVGPEARVQALLDAIETKRRNRPDPNAKLAVSAVAIEGPRFVQFVRLVTGGGDEIDPQHFEQYLRDVEQLIESHPQGNSIEAMGDPVTELEHALFASLIDPDDPAGGPIVDLIVGLRQREMLLARSWNHDGSNADLIAICIDHELDLRGDADLRAILADYGSQRFDAVVAYMQQRRGSQSSPELKQAAVVNASCLEELGAHLGDDAFASVSNTYWRQVQPTIVIDADAAHDRFARLIADVAIDVDTRLMLVQRRDAYEAEYKQLTRAMLEMVAGSFVWHTRTFVLSLPNVHGRMPDIEMSQQPKFVELFRRRENLSALTHTYLDGVERAVDRAEIDAAEREIDDGVDYGDEEEDEEFRRSILMSV